MYTRMNTPSLKIQTRKFLTPLSILAHTPLAEATTHFCHNHLVLPILEFHISGIIQKILFCTFVLAQLNTFEISLNCHVYEWSISLSVLWYGRITHTMAVGAFPALEYYDAPQFVLSFTS